MADKPKRGRPKLDTIKVMRCIRILASDWERWEAASKAAGAKNVSEYIRATMNRAAKRKGR